MLTKEYRIALPMSVEEYRIAQLYMIQKKSREESHGAGSGVEILINEPYTNGPGGNGQYTHKIYHIGSHLPSWFRAILPKSALRVEEEAWNAYPYTRTIYRCPFIEKFSLEIETRYLNEGGEHENIFNLSPAELRNRTVDYLDIVKDAVSGGDYKKEEDPRLFQSAKTSRGPLTDNWRLEYIDACNNPNNTDKAIMCAYKLCKVEFKYWGMQSKIERFIHDIGLRKTMVRAHRQAWCWQDEYYGLTIDDIRELERKTQEALKEKMAAALEGEDGPVPNEINHTGNATNSDGVVSLPRQDSLSSPESPRGHSPRRVTYADTIQIGPNSAKNSISHVGAGRKESWGSSRSKRSSSNAQGANRDLSEWRVESLEKLRTSSESDSEEFFDAQEDVFEKDMLAHNPGLFKSSSVEMLTPEDEYVDSFPPNMTGAEYKDVQFGSPLDRRVEHYKQLQAMGPSNSIDLSLPSTPTLGPAAATSCRTTILFIVLHGGSIMDTGSEQHGTKHSDISTFKATLDTVIRAHYPTILGHIAVRVVPIPPMCAETLQLLASLNPYSFDSQSPVSADSTIVTNEMLPLGAISLFATGSPEYHDIVTQVISRANATYNDFLRSEEGNGFNGQICLIGDSVGSIVGYDSLCKNNPFVYSRAGSRYGSHEGLHDSEQETDSDHHVSRKTHLETIKQASISNPDIVASGQYIGEESGTRNGTISNTHDTPSSSGSIKRQTPPYVRHMSCPNSRRTSTGSQPDLGKFDFEVSEFFMFGSPIGLVLAYRKMCYLDDRNNNLPRPSCNQMYNMFYLSDPSAVRVEPLLNNQFRHIPPQKIARYQKFPLGDGVSLHVVETIQSHAEVFLEHPGASLTDPGTGLERRQSNMSIMSQMSGTGELSITNITAITSKWWGNKRIDFALYCPDALHSFPSTALPYLLHASFWESCDVAAFILRQVVRQDIVSMQLECSTKEAALFKPAQPREKWLKRRTTIKLRNVAPNHRANDVVVLEDKPQVLPARFMYGPLDMVSLSGEKVDVHIITQPPSGEWVYYGTEVTDSSGRAVFTVPDDKRLSQGMYPVKMVVRGDHTSVDLCLTVLPPKTECVVFSIDGSFTASVSIMGKDPKVRAGAVDVVRHWQELGYLIIYITARPDMQQKKVVAWLAQHNFPHGMVSFMDGLSADPLRQKSNFLKHLIDDAKIQIRSSYGSSKDIWVYQSVNVPAESIFIVGKASKKQYKEATILSEGYASHLNDLAMGGARPAVGNARMFIRRSCFSLPGQHKVGSKKAVRKTVSLPQRGSMRDGNTKERPSITIALNESGNTVVDAGSSSLRTAARARGLSPRLKMAPYRYDASNV